MSEIEAPGRVAEEKQKKIIGKNFLNLNKNHIMVLLLLSTLLCRVENVAGGEKDSDLSKPFSFETRDPIGLKVHPNAMKLPNCRIETVGGAPTFVADDQPMGPYAYTGSVDSRRGAQLAKAGFRVFFVPVSLRKPQRLFNPEIDSKVHKLLQSVPDALLIFRIYLTPTAKFSREHPEECFAWEGGKYAPYPNNNYLDRKLGKYSFASDVWRQDEAESLEEFVGHVMDSDYCQHIAGYFLGGGGTGEWYHWWSPPGEATDFSHAMTLSFRRWLYSHYAGDVARLQTAWHDPSVTFVSAEVPTKAQRVKKEFGDFLVPATNQRTIDYMRCESDVLQDKLIYFGRVLKEISAGRSLVGAFYGYIQGNVQSSFKEVLNSPAIDFWVTPPSYENRGLGDGVVFPFPEQSLKRHNKLFIAEDDIRTHLSARSEVRYGAVDTAEDACEALKRSFGRTLCSGESAYWYEMLYGWYDDPNIVKLFTAMQQISSAVATLEKKSVSEIAVVVHQDSLLVSPRVATNNLIIRFPIHELSRIGAPYDYWEMADLLSLSNEALAKYKVVLFLNAFNLNDEERRQIDGKLKNNNRRLVWFHAPGLLRPPSGPSLENMKELTGFKFEFIPGYQSQEVDVSGGNAGGIDMPKNIRLGVFERPVTTGLRSQKIGDDRTPEPIMPVKLDGLFAVTGSDSVVLGRFKANGKPGFAVKSFSDWTSIYIGSVCVPSIVMRAIAKSAGCLLYDTDDDFICVNQHLLSIHTKTAGSRHISLPTQCDVYDLFEQKVVAKNVTSFDVLIPAKSTRLYYLGDAADIAARLDDAQKQAEARLERLKHADVKKQSARENAVPIKNAGPFEADKDGFVSDFLLSGTFPNPANPPDKGLNTDYLIKIGGETQCRPSDGVEGFHGWHVPSPLVTIGLNGLFLSPSENICYYVCFYIDIQSPQEISINIGSDDGYRLWLDEQMLGSLVASRGVDIDSNVHPVFASAGRHRILLKVEQGGGGTGFCIRVTAKNGQSLKDAKVWLTQGDKKI